jgi:hypothetical protein
VTVYIFFCVFIHLSQININVLYISLCLSLFIHKCCIFNLITYKPKCRLAHSETVMFSSAEPFLSLICSSLGCVSLQNGNIHFCRLSSDSPFVSYRHPLALYHNFFIIIQKPMTQEVHCMKRQSETDGVSNIKYCIRLRFPESDSTGLVYPNCDHGGTGLPECKSIIKTALCFQSVTVGDFGFQVVMAKTLGVQPGRDWGELRNDTVCY